MTRFKEITKEEWDREDERGKESYVRGGGMRKALGYHTKALVV